MKKTSLVLGVISLVAWLIPIAGVIVAGIGLGLSKKPDQDSVKLARALNTIGLVLAIGNWVAGIILAM